MDKTGFESYDDTPFATDTQPLQERYHELFPNVEIALHMLRTAKQQLRNSSAEFQSVQERKKFLSCLSDADQIEAMLLSAGKISDPKKRAEVLNNAAMLFERLFREGVTTGFIHDIPF